MSGNMTLQEDAGRHKQLRRFVSEQLRKAILNGDFGPGEWLRQKRIADEFGVSEMPVREALKELAADGLVEHIPYRGVRVIRFSAQDVADLYANRGCLEGMAARAATRKITDEELAELRNLWSQMHENMEPAQISLYRHLNRRYHELIYNASHGDYLIRTLNQLWLAFPMMLLSSFPQTAGDALPGRDAEDEKEHLAIIQALQERDGEMAEQLMKSHIERACSKLLSAIEAKDTESD
jgi:DNA-binding GntR family transcriptional regulator